ncbi:MAG TPA: ankyrin repeat domain-containing protein [Bryobacteraceae bacterium]|nr:ankyrin repeat domain-containing protein [Bryobacteraceae bacterium]
MSTTVLGVTVTVEHALVRATSALVPTLVLTTALLAAPSTPLIDAARNSDKAAVSTLIQKKADVNATAPDGSTALHWAAYRDDQESVRLLLGAGAKPNIANDLGVTPLWTASQNGSSAVVRQLLAAGADPNIALISGETPLMVAARSGYPDVVEQLAAKGASLNAHGTRGQTALMWAAAQQHPEVVKVLLAHKADIGLKSEVWSEVMAVPPHGYLPYNKAIPHGGETALLFAVRVGDLDSTKLLVAAGANVNDADAWGVTATSLAAHSGFTDVALFLLDKGANPNLADCGFTALHEAVMRRNEKMVTALLDHGADANAPLKTWTPTRRSSDDFNFEPQLVGATPYWLAARFDEPNIMRILVKHGADPKFVLHSEYVAEQGFGPAPRKETATPLMAAVGIIRSRAWVEVPAAQREALALETAKLAVELGSDLNTANNDGRTALDGARALKYKSVIDYLVASGAKAGSGAAPPRGSRDSGRLVGPTNDGGNDGK